MCWSKVSVKNWTYSDPMISHQWRDDCACLVHNSGVLPQKLKTFVFKLAAAVPDLTCSLDHVEYFAGQGRVTEAFRDAGLVGITFEVKADPVFQNLLTAEGFTTAVLWVLKLRPGGQILAAPVCSSWVTINAGTSGRTTEHPLGHQHLKYVQEANIMVSRTVALCLIAHSLGRRFIIEQPAGSLMPQHPRFQELMQKVPVTKHAMSMGDFGSRNRKPTWLFTNFPSIDILDVQIAPLRFDAPVERGKPVSICYEEYSTMHAALQA